MRIWWVVFPCFAGVVVRLAIERSCGAPYDLLPAVSAKPIFAWPIALVYVSAHAWILAVYLVTVADRQILVPAASDWRAIWKSDVGKLVLMVAMFSIEYAPMLLWRLIAGGLQCPR